MRKIISVGVATMFIVGFLGACTDREMGTAGGAAIGGVAGNVLTGGSTLGTVAGAVGGGVIGNQMTK